MYVCLCKAVTDADIHDAVDLGLVSFDDVKSSLSVATGCGTCRCEVDRIIQGRLEQNMSAQANLPPSANEIKLVP